MRGVIITLSILDKALFHFVNYRYIKIVFCSSQNMKNSETSGIAALFKSKSTVLTLPELASLWGITDYKYLKTRIHYYVKRGYLTHLCRGLYVKEKDHFDPREAGNKLRSPSYVSLETVLADGGVIFQKYSSLFFVSYFTKTIKNAAGQFVYKKIRDQALFNPEGIINSGTYSIASRERAFLDAVYLYKDYHFDNLNPILWKEVERLLPLYQSKALGRRIKEYKKYAQS